MQRFIAILFFVGFSAIAADTPIAVVQGTNVMFVCVADTNRFAPRPGMSNIVITADEASIVATGWRYVGGQFLRPDGTPIANGDKAKIDRAKLIAAAIGDMNTLQTNTVKATWDAMATSNKLEVVRIGLSRLSILMEKLLIEKRKELFALPEEPSQ